jgi:hypothetical protein
LPVYASDALKFRADVGRAPFECHHPRTQLPRRIVPHVLAVPALQIRNPVPFIVLVESDDAARDAASIKRQTP